jgi:hypothetical protein
MTAPPSMIYGHFRPPRHLMTAADHRRARAKNLQGLEAGDVRPNGAVISGAFGSSVKHVL